MTEPQRAEDATKGPALTQTEQKLCLEEGRIAAYRERCNQTPVKFEASAGESDNRELLLKTKDALTTRAKMAEALGTTDEKLQLYLLTQAIETFRGYVRADSRDNGRLSDFANHVMALLNGIQPKDEIEGMLAVQMIAVHNAAMEMLKTAMITGQTFAGEDAGINRATKMLRTFTMQMEAMKRYRSGGEQKVTVQHVHVNEGGQAIVGTVSTQGGV